MRTRAGQGLTDYAYFQAYLLTVQDFPAMTQSMSLYYAQYPTVSQVFGYPVSIPYGTKRVHPAAIGILSLLWGGYPITSTGQSLQ